MPGETEPVQGCHHSVVFSDDRQWAEHLAAVVRGGLEKGEQVQYFADTTAPERVLRALTDAGIDAAGAVSRGQLSVSVAAQTYLAGSRFDPDAMIGLWFDVAEAARASGYPGLRAIGEMSWGARDVTGADRLLEYELRIHHEVFARLPLKAWCFYDRRLLTDAYVGMLAGAHLTHEGEPYAEAGPSGGAPGGPAGPGAVRVGRIRHPGRRRVRGRRRLRLDGPADGTRPGRPASPRLGVARRAGRGRGRAAGRDPTEDAAGPSCRATTTATVPGA